MLTIAAGYEHLKKDLVSELRLNLCYSLNFGYSTSKKKIILLAVAVLFYYKSNSFYHNATLFVEVGKNLSSRRLTPTHQMLII